MPGGYATRKDTYRSNMVLQYPRNGHGMLGVLLGNDGQIADLESIVGGEVFEGVLVVLCDLV